MMEKKKLQTHQESKRKERKEKSLVLRPQSIVRNLAVRMNWTAINSVTFRSGCFWPPRAVFSSLTSGLSRRRRKKRPHGTVSLGEEPVQAEVAIQHLEISDRAGVCGLEACRGIWRQGENFHA